MIRLGVNIDHVATVRNARGTSYPKPSLAAALAELGGADNITMHLREDRRHIRDRDVCLVAEAVDIPINLEIANTPDMIRFAEDLHPSSVTLVPEKREELTTEGGLDVQKFAEDLAPSVQRLRAQRIKVVLFIEPDPAVIEMTKELGADACELHTGRFCDEVDHARCEQDILNQLAVMQRAAEAAHQCELNCHVGHGLHYNNAYWLQHVPYVEEANIGHAIVSRALFVGFEQAVKDMWRLLNDEREKRPLILAPDSDDTPDA